MQIASAQLYTTIIPVHTVTASLAQFFPNKALLIRHAEYKDTSFLIVKHSVAGSSTEQITKKQYQPMQNKKLPVSQYWYMPWQMISVCALVHSTQTYGTYFSSETVGPGIVVSRLDV